MINKCDTCKHEKVLVFDKPCRDCVTVDFVDGIKPDVKCSNWEPKEPCPKPADVEPPKKPKKSKWRKWDEEKPANPSRPIDAIGTLRGFPKSRLSGIYYSDAKIVGFIEITIEDFAIEVWRYMPKPPKDYLK